MMKCDVLIHNKPAGELISETAGSTTFRYHADYKGPPISVTLPVRQEDYVFDGFPPFFEGFLPEGSNLQMMLTYHKIEPDDYFSQLVAVGENLVGAVVVRKSEAEE